MGIVYIGIRSKGLSEEFSLIVERVVCYWKLL